MPLKTTRGDHGGEAIKGRGGIGKAIVQGLLERGGEVRCVVVPNQKTSTLQGTVRKHVARGSHVTGP